MSGLVEGLLQPLIMPAHVLALLGLGLLIGRQSDGRRWSLLLFVLGIVVGLLAIAWAVGETPARLVLLASAAICGLLVVIGWPIPAAIVWLLSATTGVALGLDSPPDVTSIWMARLILIGTGVGLFVVVTVLSECAARLKQPWQLIGLRVLGSWTAASAILVLAGRLAR